MSKKNKIPNLLPAAPLVPWLRERVEQETIEVFAARCGISDRRIREVLSGRAKNLSFNNVDKLITNEGTVNFIDFYPEYVDDDEFFNINESGKYETAVAPKAICSIEGCNNSMHAKDFCHRHYRQYRRNAIAA